MSESGDASHAPIDLSKATVAELFALYGGILRELRDRKIIRTLNAPVGDYAEYLVAAALGGELAPNSKKGRDVLAQGRHIQVKSRVVSNVRNAGQRELGTFRSFDFDDLVVVLFGADYTVWKAVRLPMETAKQRCGYDRHVNGYAMTATDKLLAVGEDLTERLQAATQPERPILAE